MAILRDIFIHSKLFRCWCFSEKIKLGISFELSAQIVCLVDNSHEMPSFTFSEKKRILYAIRMLGALRVKHCKWAFKY